MKLLRYGPKGQEKPGTLHLISEQVVSDENGAQKGRLISSYGYALDQAQANADRIAGISLYWNHAKVFLVGEPLAKQGLNELMGSVLADPRVRMSSFLMVAKGGDAGALFEKDADGVQFFQLQEKIDMCINLEIWDATKVYDRMGMDSEYTEILGIKVPVMTIPVKPGRNLAIIIEVAAMNNRLKRLGYNAAAELNKRLEASMNDND